LRITGINNAPTNKCT